MKKQTVLAVLLLAGQVSVAMPRYNPQRCAGDNLAQWSEGQPLQGTARGRNEWVKVCRSLEYDMAYPSGSEFEPGSQRRAYLTYGIVTGTDANKEVTFDYGAWRAGTHGPASPTATECAKPPEYRVVGYCTSGCVTPEQEITGAQGAVPMVELQQRNAEQVAVPLRLNNDEIGTELLNVRGYIKDLAPTAQKIIVVKTSGGKTLKLSTNHPMLTSDYRMKNADQLSVGDELVAGSGAQEKIVSVEVQDYYGKLYNLVVDSDDLAKSTYLVQGFVSGDKKFQDLSVSEQNRRFIRLLAVQNL